MSLGLGEFVCDPSWLRAYHMSQSQEDAQSSCEVKVVGQIERKEDGKSSCEVEEAVADIAHGSDGWQGGG